MLQFLNKEYQEKYLGYTKNLNIPLYYMEDEQKFLKYYQKNKQAIATVVLNCIKEMIKNYLLECPVFKVDIGYCLIKYSINRNNIDKILTECIEIFKETEEYEKCAEAVKILQMN